MLSSTPATGKLKPNFDRDCTKMVNLRVLQRTDRFIEEILMIASSVALYQLDGDLSLWSRKDVEGSLFVVKRSSQPRFQFIVMNRKSTENLVEDLPSDFEFEIQVPYLLYRNSAKEIKGIWFYNGRECEEIGNLFNRIITAYSKVPPKRLATPSKREFEELEAVPTSAVIEGPLEPAVNPTSTTVEPEDPSFVNFFSMGGNIENSFPNGLQSGQSHHTSVPPSPLSYVSSAYPPHEPTLHIPSTPEPYPFAPAMAPNYRSDPINSSNYVANLVKPSSFLTPSSSSSSLMPPVLSVPSTALSPMLNLQQPHGTPLLQPFPPLPSPSLASNPTPVTPYGPLYKETVRDALLMLVKDDQFVEMVYKALLKVNQL